MSNKKTFIVEVEISQEINKNNLASSQKVDKKYDEILSSLPTGGEEQIAMGLLTEALRRELYIQLLICRQKDKEIIDKYTRMKEEERKTFEDELISSSLSQMYMVSDRISKSLLQDIISCEIQSSNSEPSSSS